MTLTLPTKKTEKTQEWSKQKFLTIGLPGVGKSELWAQGERTFFFDTEGNLEHLSVFKLPVRNWEDFREAFALLAERAAKQDLPYDTIVIDTLDKWLDYAAEEVIERAKAKYAKAMAAGLEINTIGDIPEGNGWRWHRELVSTALAKLSNLGCATVLIGHVQDRQVEDLQKKYNRTCLNVGGQLGVAITGWSNHTLNIEGIYQGANLVRIVYTVPSQSREAKSHGGIVPNGWKWEADMKANYAKLRGLFT